MNNTKKSLMNFITSLFSQIVVIALGLIIPRLTLVGYGSEVNGLLNSVTQFIVYLNLFESGIYALAMQAMYKPVKTGDTTAINRILSAVNQNYKRIGAAYGLSLLALAVIYPLFVRSETVNYFSIFLIVLFSGLGNVVLFFFQAKYRILLQAEGKSYILNNINTIISVLKNAAKILLLSLGYNVVFVVAAAFAVSLIQCVYILVLIHRRYKWINLHEEPNYSALEQKNSMLFHQISYMIFQNTDVLLLTMFCNLKVVSVYSLYKMITSHIGSVMTGAFNSFSFALGQMYNTDKAKFTRYIDAVDVYFGGIAFAVYTVAAYLLLPFLRLYTQGVTDIAYVDVYLCILFVAVELLNYMRLPLLNTTIYAGHFKNTLGPCIVETSLNIVVSLVGVFCFGIYGVLLGTVAALLYRNVDIFFYSNHRLLERKATKSFLIYAVDIVIFVVLLFVLQSLGIHINSYWDFLKVGIITAPAVLVVFFAVLSLLFKNERKLLLEGIRRKKRH